jgi:transketolase
MSHLPPSADSAVASAATAIRILTVDAVRAAGIGHIGLPLGCAEIGVVLFSEFLKHDPEDPQWLDRDRFVLSAGHGSMLLYSLLHLSGYGLPMDEIRRFRQLGSITPGHPEVGDTPGVETTTGPLGQGLGNAVGMALAERLLAARLGSDLIDHRTYALASDGDVMEGVASEAASLAGHLGLGRLIAIYDDNGITIDGPTSITFSENVARRFEAYGWDVQSGVDGHDPDAVRSALARARESEDRPHLIVCKTHIGFGSPAADTNKAHGWPGGKGEEFNEQTREALGWTLPPFEVPPASREVFQANAERGAKLRGEWEKRAKRARKDKRRAALVRAMVERKLPDDLDALLPDFRSETGKLATRVASGRVLNAVAAEIPSLIGGSADLAGSNNTPIDGAGLVERGKFEGRNIHFGVREHGMAAIANGLALHGGIRPYVGTFLVFSDYMRAALRLSALMGTRVAFVFTHDSIFVGEDGPTHQPIEQVAALRAIPNLHVWRPADARETVVAWRATLAREDGPTAFALTRQGVPILEGEGVEEGARRGGYVALRESGAAPELVIVGTGSETQLAIEAAQTLNAEGRRVRAVSLPCLEVFDKQDADYRADVLGDAPRLVVEAGVALGLGTLLRAGDRFHGLDRFGASAPYPDLAEHFGFTTARVTQLAREMLG